MCDTLNRVCHVLLSVFGIRDKRKIILRIAQHHSQPSACYGWHLCFFELPTVFSLQSDLLELLSECLHKRGWGRRGRKGRRREKSSLSDSTRKPFVCVCRCFSQRSSSAVCSSGRSLHSLKTSHPAIAHALSFSFFRFIEELPHVNVCTATNPSLVWKTSRQAVCVMFQSGTVTITIVGLYPTSSIR